MSVAFATVGNWFLSAVFTLEIFRLYCENGYNITVKHLKERIIWWNITWSEMWKQNLQAKKVYSEHHWTIYCV